MIIIWILWTLFYFLLWKKWETYIHHQLGKANKILYLFHDSSPVSLFWIYPLWKTGCYFNFSCKVDPVERSFSRRPWKYQIENITIFHRLHFLRVLIFSFGAKFQRWLKGAKMCATQVCKTGKRERITKMSHTHKLYLACGERNGAEKGEAVSKVLVFEFPALAYYHSFPIGKEMT